MEKKQMSVAPTNQQWGRMWTRVCRALNTRHKQPTDQDINTFVDALFEMADDEKQIALVEKVFKYLAEVRFDNGGHHGA
jgi:hypothetical protein